LDKEPSQSSCLTSILDVLALLGPVICLIDCLVVPIALAILPVAGVHPFFHGIGDQVLALLVLAILAPVLIPGFLRHRKKRVLALAALGFTLIFFANFLSHALDETMHVLLSIAGGLALFKANIDNRNWSSRCACHMTVIGTAEATSDGPTHKRN
jgi:hypothetical protein